MHGSSKTQHTSSIMFTTVHYFNNCANCVVKRNMITWLRCCLDSYLLTGEIPMHLLYGFNPLIGQDTLKHRIKNYQTPAS